MDIEHIRSARRQAQHQSTRQPSRKRRILTLIGICTFNTVLLIFLVTQLLTPAHKSVGSHTSNVTVLGDAASPLIGQPAPDFTLPMLSGASGSSHLHLAALKGKPVILNFWASWCAPCNDEAAFLQRSWPALKAHSVILIGIDGPEPTSNAFTFIHKYAISYPNVQDAGNSATALSYEATGFPETVFINSKGVVVAKWISPLNAQGLQLEEAKL